MTTVVYRDGVLATDSAAETSGWRHPVAAQKMWRADDGRLFAITGDQAAGTDAVAKIMRGEAVELSEHARVIEICPGNPVRIVIHEEGGTFELSPEFDAWGSGMPPALGALHAGADAAEAVRIASLVDPNTGGEVVVMELAAKPVRAVSA